MRASSSQSDTVTHAGQHSVSSTTIRISKMIMNRLLQVDEVKSSGEPPLPFPTNFEADASQQVPLVAYASSTRIRHLAPYPCDLCYSVLRARQVARPRAIGVLYHLSNHLRMYERIFDDWAVNGYTK